MNTKFNRYALSVALAASVGLSACSPNDSEQAPATTAPANATATVPEAALTKDQVKVSISAVGSPTYSAADNSVSVVLEVSNQGTAALPFAGNKPVSVGIVQLISGPEGTEDKRGTDARAPLSADLAPGASTQVVAHVPAAMAIGHKIQFELIQENVAWFGFDYGQPVAVVGPFAACAADAKAVCAADGSALAPAAP